MEVARVLLLACANRDFANNDCFTALMAASEQGHVEVARILLEAGASKDLANNDGFTALIAGANPPRTRQKELRFLWPAD